MIQSTGRDMSVLKSSGVGILVSLHVLDLFLHINVDRVTNSGKP